MNSTHKLALVVPYRDREAHLQQFLPHIKRYLQQQQIDYHVHIVEQEAGKPFNKGVLMNRPALTLKIASTPLSHPNPFPKPFSMKRRKPKKSPRSSRRRSLSRILGLEPLEPRKMWAVVNIGVSAAEIQENPDHGLNSIVVAATTDEPVNGQQVVDVVVSGNGITPADYTLSSVSIVIPDGESSGAVTFTSVNDPDLEIRETATLTLTNLSAELQPGATLSQDVDIRDSFLPDLELSDMQALRNALSPVVNWVGDQPCTWQGVTCTSTNVASLIVEGENAELLTLPPTPNLTEMFSFQLTKIELTGSLPNIEHLPLRILRLDDNQLSGPLRELSDDLARSNPDIAFFNAAANALTGPIPAGLAINNAAMQVILSRNQLSGPLPTDPNAVGHTRFDFSGNMIDGVVPDYITDPDSPISLLLYNMLDVVNSPQPGTFWRSTQTVPPTDVQVSSPIDGTAVLTWTPILYQGDGGHYEVLSSTTPGGPYTSRGTTAASGAKTATGLTVTGLPSGTNYFVVRTFTPKHSLNPNDLTSIYSEEVSTDTGPLTVSLSAFDAVADESGDPGMFRLTRDNPNDALTVNLTRSGASTAADSEFELTVGADPPIDVSGGNFSVTFPDGRDTLDITLTALVDANDEAEADETITLDLAAGDYVIDGSANTAAVTIAQNGFLVTTDSDGGTGSLRQAILNADAIPGPNTITFGDGSASGGTNFLDATPDTIGLNSELTITEDLTIVGNGSSLTILDGQDATRLFSIPASAGDVTLQGLTFTRGQAPANDVGGAIANSANLHIDDSVFTANEASLGAAINTDGSLTINRSSFLTNHAGVNGGAIRVFGTATISESTFASNSAGNGGGAIINHGGLQSANATFSDNQAVTGGAIENFGAGTTATITNTTIHQNSATLGGGIYNNGGTATLQNTIVAGNPSGGDLISTTAPGSFSGTNNLVGDGNVPSGLLNTLTSDPLLGPLQNNGGPTATHALLPGSPAINTGAASGAPVTDQRGVTRDAVPDIGAFEVHSTAVVGAANTVTVAGNQITIDIIVENFGTETAGNLTLVNDLDGTFGAGNYVLASAPVLVSHPGTLTLSASYDGSSTTDLLSAGSTLPAGETAQVRIVVTLTTITDRGRGLGVYSNQSVVTSTDPGSVLSIDRSDSGADPDPNGNGVPSEAGENDATEFRLDTVAPQVEQIEINGGDTQRSMVSEITVRFSEIVSADASSFSVQNTTTNTTFVPTVSSQVVAGKTVATLTFSGPGIIGGSLPDGNYTLTVIDTQVTDTAGNILDGDGDGQAGVSATDDFFRLFGDADGDRDVDRRDYLFLLQTYDRGVGDAGFNSALDYDGDGDVDSQDLRSFRSNYRRILLP
ncbi:Galactosyltransferase [Stieleria neptunia]|uniref:Galactosyltransferase n=1 Tax=Stieleria neptunia TaxID=2527979 RepID=A0A518I2Z5_9BACT|nr:Ig-like domain-containing protein [Stieleria neptunia]QDV47458.1 Galactosyltransferase [Stieleria neptunia]